jgi:hypothetical protein
MVLMTVLCNTDREELSGNFGLECTLFESRSDCPGWDLPWFSSVRASKCPEIF